MGITVVAMRATGRKMGRNPVRETAMRHRAAAAVLVAGLCLLPVTTAASGDVEGRAEADERVAAILSITADPAYGAYLAGDCVTCHRQSGGADGIPPIAGLPAEHTVNALVEYKLGIRDNEVMVIRVARLGDEEIAALAAHFAEQKP